MSHQFYIGQKVVCVNATVAPWATISVPLKEGHVYECDGVRLCRKCRDTVISVGLSHNRPFQSVCSCGDVETLVEWWFSARRFRPLDSLTEQVTRIEKEGAPVELETVEAIDHTHPEWCDGSELTLEELTNPALWPPFQQP